MSYENLGSITKKVKSGRKNVLAHSYMYIIKQIIDATKHVQQEINNTLVEPSHV